ncbi:MULTISPECIES: hypothetical protein [Acinetobacter]|uniref:Uncharacterized protein n=1 Tax=Acinetobacter towneri TaxID=202956 RepID=A0AAP9KIY8_9GAMM|nr:MULTISPECIES: hypothetical protein [Acinetobacter]MCA4799587.1 hypothetical protein [Acinetobacter towneri]QGM27418.1 hypothetical protein GJD93_06885 [Acinetobacter towneri]
MLFLDDTAQTEPQRKITLDLSQDAATIQQHIVALSQKYQPELIVAEGLEADFILESLTEILPHCGGIALKHPTDNVSLEKLQHAYLQRGKQRFYEVRIMLLQTHPQFKSFSRPLAKVKNASI